MGLRFTERETKNRMRLGFDPPRHVEPYLAFYLEGVRSSLNPAPDCRRLWVSVRGEPLSARMVYQRILLATERLFGTPISPHGFRTYAATSFALRSPPPGGPAAGASLLRHN